MERSLAQRGLSDKLLVQGVHNALMTGRHSSGHLTSGETRSVLKMFCQEKKRRNEQLRAI